MKNQNFQLRYLGYFPIIDLNCISFTGMYIFIIKDRPNVFHKCLGTDYSISQYLGPSCQNK